YLAALGSIAYILMLALGLVMAIGAYSSFRVPYQAMQDGKGDFYAYLLPGALAALATFLLLGLFFGGLPGLLLFPIVLLALAILGFVYLQIQQARPISYAINGWLTMLLTFSAIFLVLLVFQELNTISAPYLDALSQVVSYNKYIMPVSQQFTALVGVMAGAG